ncbi:prepilin peptidase [Anaerovorax odorimutans]|uniref:prepilin peptidase n=1 Tax=Anaerovorax odorimutans TaxID=109327 RepID=UPI000483243B|nr:A24 family peptidase [Anaerovorax odorimutans]
MTVKVILAIIIGICAGFSTIYVFNIIPPRWLCDYGEEPKEEITELRIKKNPWCIFSFIFFTLASFKLMEHPSFVIFFNKELFMVTLLSLVSLILKTTILWLLLQIAIADKKYMIIPDQFIIGIAIIGFIYIITDFIIYGDTNRLIDFLRYNFLHHCFAALIGGGTFFFIGILGSIIFKKEAMGFGDIKLLTSVGFFVGISGIINTLIFTIFVSAFVFSIGILIKKIDNKAEQPLAPFIVFGAIIVTLFKTETDGLLYSYLNLL